MNTPEELELAKRIQAGIERHGLAHWFPDGEPMIDEGEACFTMRNSGMLDADETGHPRRFVFWVTVSQAIEVFEDDWDGRLTITRALSELIGRDLRTGICVECRMSPCDC